MNLNIPASSLQADHSGFMTKVGGGVRTWKRRWFVLSGKSLYYYKKKNDPQVTGIIELSAGCSVTKANKKKEKKFCFAVETPQRTFLMYPDTEKEMEEWMAKINQALNGGAGTPSKTVFNDQVPSSLGAGASTGEITTRVIKEPSPQQQSGGSRGKLEKGKDAIPWLLGEDSKVLEFWQIWSESIPPTDDSPPDGGPVVFEVATSADLEKLSWRASGPQNIFIQKMVDFFWNVGAPESEIDRLNDVGALINPNTIGSWIDMSSKGGMDGGWFFPVDVDIKTALEAADSGEPLNLLTDWLDSNGVSRCIFVGRDMGAAPPRQTEIRFNVPGATFGEQFQRALTMYPTFSVPPIPEDVISLVKDHTVPGIMVSVITSSEGFVRVGLMVSSPGRELVNTLCSLGSANPAQVLEFQEKLGVNGPENVEFQYLMQGFGYGVYKEGFDVVFHYKVGGEENHGAN